MNENVRVIVVIITDDDDDKVRRIIIDNFFADGTDADVHANDYI